MTPICTEPEPSRTGEVDVVGPPEVLQLLTNDQHESSPFLFRSSPNYHSPSFLSRMGWVKLTTPLLFQSKLLCISLLYLLTTAPLSLYVSFSQRGCLFLSPPLLSHPLFSYPSSYGEHKHALPASHSSCSSPVFFSGNQLDLSIALFSVTTSKFPYQPFEFLFLLPDYRVAFEEIHNIRSNRSFSPTNSSSPVLRYLQEKGKTFAGNFSTQKRRSFFYHGDDRAPVPCGFLREFLVKESGSCQF